MKEHNSITSVKIKLKKLRENAGMPYYGTEFSAGADLCAAVDEAVAIGPGETVAVGTGIALEIPTGLVGLVFGRSGLASKRDLAPANKVGVIDSDYRGEITVMIHNHGKESREIIPGERIAQIVFVSYIKGVFEEADSLCETKRGEGGFGSTGRK
ncbi:MAG: dUTP diphosphatase [Clostridia bacterium]|nr:dUTP diphosphatase [Clostridia bacterium]